MTKKTVKGSIDSAYGKPLADYNLPGGVTKLNYEVEADQFDSASEIREAGEWPNEKSIVKMVNARKVAAKRQEGIKNTLDTAGIKPPTLEDVSEALKATAKILLAQKLAKTEEEALQKARVILGQEEEEPVEA